jgi:aminocarboxymuconate-semialdehyde decarboxylase
VIGTDHPFFPPLAFEAKEWASVTTNYDAISRAFEGDKMNADAVLGGNAIRVLRLSD